MRCRDCEDYKVCVRTNDLRKKRGQCRKAKEIKFITNADRIRAKTDEELAEWECDRSCSLCPIEGCEGRMEEGRKKCKLRWLDWLKQEVDDAD